MELSINTQSSLLPLILLTSCAISHPSASSPELSHFTSNSEIMTSDVNYLKTRQATYEFRHTHNLWGNGKWCYWWCKDRDGPNYVPLDGDVGEGRISSSNATETEKQRGSGIAISSPFTAGSESNGDDEGEDINEIAHATRSTRIHAALAPRSVLVSSSPASKPSTMGDVPLPSAITAPLTPLNPVLSLLVAPRTTFSSSPPTPKTEVDVIFSPIADGTSVVGAPGSVTSGSVVVSNVSKTTSSFFFTTTPSLGPSNAAAIVRVGGSRGLVVGGVLVLGALHVF